MKRGGGVEERGVENVGEGLSKEGERGYGGEAVTREG